MEALTDRLIAGFVLVAVALLLFVSQIQDQLSFDWMNGLPGFDNIRRLAYYTAPILALCLARLAWARTIHQTVPLLAVAVLGWSALFWNGARAAVVAVCAAFVIGAVLLPALRTIRLWSAIAATAVLGMLIARWSATPVGFMGLGRMTALQIGGDPQDPTSGVTSGRADLWLATLEKVAERPLFGHGEGQLWSILPQVQEFGILHPHNLLLQSLLAWGMMGTCLLLILGSRLAQKALIAVRGSSRELTPHLMLVLTIGLYSLVDGTLFHVQSTALFAAGVGVLLGSAPQRGAGDARLR